MKDENPLGIGANVLDCDILLSECGLVGFYGISTFVGYLMPNLFYTYILNMFDLVLWNIDHGTLFNAKSIFKHINNSILEISV